MLIFKDLVDNMCECLKQFSVVILRQNKLESRIQLEWAANVLICQRIQLFSIFFLCLFIFSSFFFYQSDPFEKLFVSILFTNCIYVTYHIKSIKIDYCLKVNIWCGAKN